MTPLVFFGTDDFSLPSLRALHEAGFDVRLVVTRPDAPAGRHRHLTPPPVKVEAERLGIPVAQPSRPLEALEQISGTGAKAGVVASYGRIIPNKILMLFDNGLVNVHPSLLPKYRGPSPVETAILNGDKTTGVSLMQVTDKMDAGPVYSQNKVPLTGHETGPALRENLSKIGAQMLTEHLPAILEGKLKPQTQDEKAATYTRLLTKDDARLDWSLPAATLERQIRAHLGWPGSRAQIASQDVIVTAAHPSSEAQNAQRSTIDEQQPDGNRSALSAQRSAFSGRSLRGRRRAGRPDGRRRTHN